MEKEIIKSIIIKMDGIDYVVDLFDIDVEEESADFHVHDLETKDWRTLKAFNEEIFEYLKEDAAEYNASYQIDNYVYEYGF